MHRPTLAASASFFSFSIMISACGGAPPPAAAPADPGADACADAATCAAIGIDLAKRGDDARAAVALGKACTLRHVDACATLASVKPKDLTPSQVGLIAHKGCSVEGATQETRPTRGAACRTWGEHVERETPAGVEPQGAYLAFEDGCKLGDARSCTRLQRPRR